MNVTLRQLRVFQAVIELGGFSRAGDALGLTQPAVSRAVRELEQALDLRLFDRTTREVEPTAAARRLQGKLMRVLEALQEALSEARMEGAQAHGVVHVASSPTLSASLMPLLIARCRRLYPQLRLVLHDQVQRLNIDAVASGQVDFGLVVEPDAAAPLESEPLLEDDFWLVCRKDHALAGQAAAHWAQLDGQPLVLLDHSSGSRRLIDELLARHGLACEVAQQLGHSQSVFRMVAAGLGLSVTPGLAMPPPAGCGLSVLPLLPVETRRIVLIKRPNRSLSPLARKVWQLALEMRAELAAAARPAAWGG
ncbi:DNA-binding transcriptional LysR family regulator [Chromobacterium alkanivorans]|uniref:LysR family transcriptional regulator n=1 Tax=Chromobacterium TaxID=535 RepID=UPI000652B4CC|nr:MULTISPECIES: LysR family transcriptional regulator [Chromobacterium]KMN82064.1 LysR family transcriptional regulator [Chromobacterium sp. LK11]MCS3803586.1 DNA-binding transcriptional LysR family regulator [Chromobacterium alkanivorans]MCS3818309.1 DNA-binding transcriptional LysR family regulator [Chromobacterium alkanivorans]MCS3874492.1 DNA-binding transcriptional LysR family regulator [Chromobacterium alkanivorans]